MKKQAVAAIRGFALGLVVILSFLNTAEANTPLLDRNLSLQTLAVNLPTPNAIADYLWKNFLFEEDQRNFGKEDYWQNPEEFLTNKKGDCEDFALFASRLLKLQGIQSLIVNIYGGGSGHTICVFKENGRYDAFDGSTFKKIEAGNLNSLISKIKPDWEKASIVSFDPDSHTASFVAQIQK